MASLIRHQTVHTEDGTGIKCEFCPGWFKSEHLYDKHVRYTHGYNLKSISHPCTKCSYRTPPYRRNYYELVYHMKKYHPTKDKEGFKCDYCPGYFKNRVNQ